MHQDCYRLSGHKMAGRRQIPAVTKIKRVPISFVARLFEDEFWEHMYWRGAQVVELEVVGEWVAFWHGRDPAGVKACIDMGEVKEIEAWRV